MMASRRIGMAEQRYRFLNKQTHRTFSGCRPWLVALREQAPRVALGNHPLGVSLLWSQEYSKRQVGAESLRGPSGNHLNERSNLAIHRTCRGEAHRMGRGLVRSKALHEEFPQRQTPTKASRPSDLSNSCRGFLHLKCTKSSRIPNRNPGTYTQK